MPGPITRNRIGAATFVVTLGISCWLGRPVLAQTTGGQSSGGLDVALAGSILTSITITVSGTTNPGTGVATTVTAVGNRGNIEFGDYQLGSTSLNTGDLFRVTDQQNPGAYLVATLRVRSTFTGGGGTIAAIDIQRTNPCAGGPDVPCGNPGALFFALPRGQGRIFPRWRNYPDAQYGRWVHSVPESSFIPGAGNLTASLTSGSAIDHQVAVWIPDAQLAGPFSTVVTYTATRL